MTISATKRITLEEYLNYDDGTDTRYELLDGVLVAMGAESTINTRIAVFLIKCFLRLGLDDHRLGIKQKITVCGTGPNAREPDLMIHSEASARALDGETQALLKADYPNPLIVIEVVSPGQPGTENYDRDYLEKPREYAERGIPEYWLIDPERGIVQIRTLVNGQYQMAEFSGSALIRSFNFPQLNLSAIQILQAGR